MIGLFLRHSVTMGMSFFLIQPMSRYHEPGEKHVQYPVDEVTSSNRGGEGNAAY